MLSERERRQLDTIEHDLLRDAEFVAAITDVLHGSPHRRRRTAVRLTALAWALAILASAGTGRYLLGACLALLASAVCLIFAVHGMRRRRSPNSRPGPT